jgi:tetrahydromethanopterin:alpha-L-glutamate ligase
MARNMIGIIGLPGAWSTDLLADAIEKRTGFRMVIDPETLTYSSGGDVLTTEGRELPELDALILRKMGAEYAPCMLDRLQLLRVLKVRGVRIFSDPDLVAAVIDRIACTMGLRLAGVPMPETTITEDARAAAAAVQEYGTAVLKPVFSTKARGMRIIRRGQTVAEELQQFRAAGNPLFYVQKLLELPGRDLGVVFMGGEYVGVYAREAAPHAWNTTVNAGGAYRVHEASSEVIELARRAQAVFGLDYTTVDIVETENGSRVLEVSAFGGFRGLYEACGVNAAELLADYVISRVASGGWVDGRPDGARQASS